jgi:serine/threonine-protein kinase
MSASAPSRIGRYRVLGQIARGGSADVFVGVIDEDHGPVPRGQRVALKRLHPHLATDDAFVRMFLEEARLGARLQHPGLVRVLDLDEDDDTIFVALALVDGPSLSAAIRLVRAQAARVPSDVVIAIGTGVAAALAHVHAARDPATGGALALVHRDVNPQNIVVGVDEHGQGCVKLVDLGVARAMAAGTAAARPDAGARQGKASAMAPEQVRGHAVDARADLWGLGVTLHALLALAPPFSGDGDVALADAILHAPPPPLAALRDDLDDERGRGLGGLVLDLLRKDRDARPESAVVVVQRLRALAPSSPSPSSSSPSSPSSPSPSSSPAVREQQAIARFVASLALPSLRA